jgi:integrase
VVRFLEAAPGVKYKAALSVAYGAGLRVSEVATLKVSDIDSERMMLRVEQGKGRKNRHAMLSPLLLDLVADCATDRLAVYRPGPAAADIDAPAQPGLPCCSRHGGDQKARYPAHPAG